MNTDEYRDEAINDMFQDFYKSPLNDETVGRLRKGLRKLYPDALWEGKHIEALELHGADTMEWHAKHGPKDLGKFLSVIQVDVEKD